MKSVKPGRGPSMMGGVVGIFMIGFGILWTILAAQASGIFALFGVLWTCIAIAMTIYNFKNATSENRYSEFDIVDSQEEPDPLSQRFHPEMEAPRDSEEPKTDALRFCPYCGARVNAEFEYCGSCGKKLPQHL